MRLATIATLFSATLLAMAPIVVRAEEEEEKDITRDALASHIHSLYSPYTHDQYENDDWDFGGNTIVRVYNEVRLTSDQPSQEGWLWSKSQLEAPAWTIEFEFRIHGLNPSLHGDGLAFWYTPDLYTRGPVYGFKDKFVGLAVFFDTYGNGPHEHSFPFISAMLGDGAKSYDHDNDNQASVLGHGCEANIRGSEENLKARVTYFKNKMLELQFKDDGETGWQTCFSLEQNITLPDKGYIGFTAATGDAHDNHDIHSVSTYIHKQETPITHHADPFAAGSSSSSSFSFSGFVWSTVVFLLKAGAVSAVAAAAFFAYRSYTSKSLKRF